MPILPLRKSYALSTWVISKITTELFFCEFIFQAVEQVCLKVSSIFLGLVSGENYELGKFLKTYYHI